MKNGLRTVPEVSPRNSACCFSELKRIPNLFSRKRILNRLTVKDQFHQRSAGSGHAQFHVQLPLSDIGELESFSPQERQWNMGLRWDLWEYER